MRYFALVPFLSIYHFKNEITESVHLDHSAEHV